MWVDRKQQEYWGTYQSRKLSISTQISENRWHFRGSLGVFCERISKNQFEIQLNSTCAAETLKRGQQNWWCRVVRKLSLIKKQRVMGEELRRSSVKQFRRELKSWSRSRPLNRTGSPHTLVTLNHEMSVPEFDSYCFLCKHAFPLLHRLLIVTGFDSA